MNKALVIVLASVAFSSSGRRVPKDTRSLLDEASSQSSPAAKPIPSKSLSKLLRSFNPTFTASRPIRFCNDNQCVNHRKTLEVSRGRRSLMRGGACVPIEARKDFAAVLGVTSLLTVISGMVNAVAFLEMGVPCTHHTGSALHIGRLAHKSAEFGSLSAGTAAPCILLLVITYIIGAAMAGYAKCNGQAVYAGDVSLGLLGSAAAVAVGSVLRFATGAIIPTLAIFSFSQGIQNAITTSAAGFLGFPIRTTHVTGAATDLGTGIGQWFAAKAAGEMSPSLRKPLVFAAGLVSFALGCFFARILHPAYGVLTALFPAGFLAILSVGRPGMTTKE